MSHIDEIREALRMKTKKHHIEAKDLLSSGSTLLNLACTGRTIGCFVRGKYYLVVGDSQSGKTFIALTVLAEVCRNKHYDDYRIILDNAEDGALMDITKFFGQRVSDRLESPGTEDGEPVFSRTVQDFYYYVDDANKGDKPFIYILDSMDMLVAEEDAEHFEKSKSNTRKGKDTGGSYGTAKSKLNSEHLRKVLSDMRKTGSILIIISQTRDNIGFGAQFNPKTRSGGRALKFYATLEIWLSVKEKIKKTVKGKPRSLGIISKVQVKKNRVTGRDRTVYIPLYHSFGIDDTGSMIDYLVAEGHWKKSKGGIKATEFDYSGNRDQLIRRVEEYDLERELRALVGRVWTEIEDACIVERKARYQ